MLVAATVNCSMTRAIEEISSTDCLAAFWIAVICCEISSVAREVWARPRGAPSLAALYEANLAFANPRYRLDDHGIRLLEVLGLPGTKLVQGHAVRREHDALLGIHRSDQDEVLVQVDADKTRRRN